jgi:hypothetical protein
MKRLGLGCYLLLWDKYGQYWLEILMLFALLYGFEDFAFNVLHSLHLLLCGKNEFVMGHIPFLDKKTHGFYKYKI